MRLVKWIWSDCAEESDEDIGGCEREWESGTKPCGWLCFVEWSTSCPCLPFRSTPCMGGGGISRHLIFPPILTVKSPINEVLNKKIRSKWKVCVRQAATHYTFGTSVTPSVLLNCSDHYYLCWMMTSCIPIYVNYTKLCVYSQYKWQSQQCCPSLYFLLPSLFSTSCHLLKLYLHRL